MGFFQYLFGGACICMLMASLIFVTNLVTNSATATYVVGGIVLLSFVFAVKYKKPEKPL